MSFVYDVAEIDELSHFVYDVKILYQIKGYKFSSLSDLCVQCLEETETATYHQVCEKLKSHLRSYLECDIIASNYSLGELIPEHVLSDLRTQKKVMIDRLFNRFSDEHAINFYEQFFPRIQCLHRISKNLGLKFNFVGSKTGRLGFKQHTFNPYVLPKSKRTKIGARKDHQIYQFDLKSSQPRIAIFCTPDEHFKNKFAKTDDIYSAFPGDRQTNKIQFLRWMYSANFAADQQFSSLVGPIKKLRASIFDDCVHSHLLFNPFGRPLYFSDEDRRHPNLVFQRYISSTEADALYEIVVAMEQALKDTNSRILFPFYDAVICEIANDDQDIPDMLRCLIENHYQNHMFHCKFPVEVKHGPDMGHMVA